jgi:calcineurin-like phosphoesterase family protein
MRHCARPFEDVNDMNEFLVETWNSHVGRKEHTAVIGDLAFKRHAYWVNALNGRITLIVGNHDKMPLKSLANFTQAVGKDRYPGILEYRVDNQAVVLCHYPLYSWRWSSYGAWMLHGHSHGRVQHPEHILSLDVGVDTWGLAPIPWAVVSDRMSRKAAAHSAHKAALDRRPVDYWADVVQDQYRDNMQSWVNAQVPQAIPYDPRDVKPEQQKGGK